MKFICGLRAGRARRPLCNETFATLKDLAEHINEDHRCLVKIKTEGL